MTCQPSRTKCEWATLQFFVKYYNDINGTAYGHECCLDRMIRDDPQPEVFCRDSDTGNTLVIESKHLNWPPNEAQRHAAWHQLVDAILQELKGMLDDAPFLLHLDAPSAYDDKRIEAAAKDVALSARKIAPTLRIGDCRKLGSHIGASLERQHPRERDEGHESSGVRFEVVDAGATQLLDVENTPSLFDGAMNKIYSACDTKFKHYSLCRRLLELRTTSGAIAFELNTIWWHRYFERNPPTSSIDEIWFTFCYEEHANLWARALIYETGDGARR